MDRSSKFILRKLIVDLLCVFIVGIAVLMFYLFGKPYKRGFFCNDESLYHPYHESTVTSPMLYVTGLCLPACTVQTHSNAWTRGNPRRVLPFIVFLLGDLMLLVESRLHYLRTLAKEKRIARVQWYVSREKKVQMLIGEYLHARHFSGHTAKVLFGYTIPPWLWNAYEKIGVFIFGATCTSLTTDIAKYSIGRLRPHFMKLCVPNIDCSLPENQHRYIEQFNCTASGISAKLLKEVRLSFPSGHSSSSAYTMIYLAMYLQLRIKWKGSKLLKHFLQLLCLLMAWFTAMSRISNYKHHWSDVLAGSTLGTICALLVAHCVADLFKEEREKHYSTEKHRPADYETETGIASTQDELYPLKMRLQSYGGFNTNTEDSTQKLHRHDSE